MTREGHLSPTRIEDSLDEPLENLLSLEVGLGRRVVVVGNLNLSSVPTQASKWVESAFARMLDTWRGPGAVILAGNLVDLRPDTSHAADRAQAALKAHPRLSAALRAFAAEPERQLVFLPGSSDEVAAQDPRARSEIARSTGARAARAVDLTMTTTAGERRVRVEAMLPDAAFTVLEEGAPGDTRDQLTRSGFWRQGVPYLARDLTEAPWQKGVDRLSDPKAVQRFLSSRVLYRRLARYTWWLLVPLVVALGLRIAFVTNLLGHLTRGHSGPASAILRGHHAGWGPRLAVTFLITGVEFALLTSVLGLLSRKAFRALGGGKLPGLFEEDISQAGATVNDRERDYARTLTSLGYSGIVTGSSLQAELTHFGPDFFACVGACGELVEERPGRIGLPPVFVEQFQTAWVELETGADLHTRLLIARKDIPCATLLERLAVQGSSRSDSFPAVVAAHPRGSSWPPVPDLGEGTRRSRRTRRWAAGLIFLAGAIDLVSALTPPLRGRLHVVLQLVPLAATQTAAALVALAAMSLFALARGIRRGQRRAWAIASGVLAATLVLNLLRGGDFEESLFSAGVLTVLLANRHAFGARSDRPSLRSAFVALGIGAFGVSLVALTVVEVTVHLHRHAPRMGLLTAALAVIERLVGVQTVALYPERLDDFLSPGLLAIGVGLAAVALLLATRPAVDRRLGWGRIAEARARDIVTRHGEGTLDYFALRSDKQWFFHRDSLVAYAIYGGVCLVSPDPIGPGTEREQVWEAFKRFSDERGWVVAVMGAAEEWLPVYRAGRMHDIYIGDEAVVDLTRFSLDGGHMKGLRQAHNRIAKYGYTASFRDPTDLDRPTAESLAALMAQGRRGDFERGFSMMLGRIFDPRDKGLLLCIVTGPDGAPAAMCQFVPAPAIRGFSLDLMRRDRGEHPNGLIDFALVSTIEHLRDNGYQRLSLNFAAMRSILEGKRGDGLTQRVERWALQKMSGFLQIESLWRFNAKYRPDWLPRYIVYDTAEHAIPAIIAVMRAEALSEVPVIGRILAKTSARRASALQQDR